MVVSYEEEATIDNQGWQRIKRTLFIVVVERRDVFMENPRKVFLGTIDSRAPLLCVMMERSWMHCRYEGINRIW